MPVAPTVRYNDQIMVESGAIIEMLLARHGNGKLAPPVSSPDFLPYLTWMHFAEARSLARDRGLPRDVIKADNNLLPSPAFGGCGSRVEVCR